MAAYCQMAAQSRSGERPNIRAVNSFEGKKKGGSQLQTKNQVRVETCKKCLFFTLFCRMHYIHYMKSFIENLESLLYTI